MKSSKKAGPVVALLAFCVALSVPMAVSAQQVDGSIAACLKAWGNHPFGDNPKFKTLGTSVNVFGIGKTAADTEFTSFPSLVLVNPIINVMGVSTVNLSNSNGWYCLRTALSVIGTARVRVQCKAQLAMTSDGKTVVGDNAGNNAIRNIDVTVVGSIPIERPCN